MLVITNTIDKINETTKFPIRGIFLKIGVYKINKGIIIKKINDLVIELKVKAEKISEEHLKELQ